MSTTIDALERLRSIIAAWPETTEKLSHGSPTWWGGRRTFASFDDHHAEGRVAVWVKSTLEEQELRVAADPETYFVPPYMGPGGWLGVRLDVDPDWRAVADLLEAGYRAVAPKRALALLQ